MSAYQINDVTFRANSYWEARDVALSTYQEGVDVNDYIFQVNGKVVSREQFVESCKEAEQKASDKKNKTHKLISWKEGDCSNTIRHKWVKR